MLLSSGSCAEAQVPHRHPHFMPADGEYPPQRGLRSQNGAAVVGQVEVLMIWGRSGAVCYTLEVASTGEAGPAGIIHLTAL